ncbi:thiamine phosphate synthase [Nocardioides sp. Bht2]|uniref:thiamine phosphate synthase n=1 Tax=Nocardioides sp. Bht2 TaxID=3392297 RepID=UPI0039B4DCAD
MSAFRIAPPLPRLFCLVSGRDDLALLPELADVGVAGFQVRDKELPDWSLRYLVDRVLSFVGDRSMVVINDRLGVAVAAQAHGVHLGREDLPIDRAREQAPELVIGATCRSRDDVDRASALGADYAGFGPIAVSGSKQGLPEPLGCPAITSAVGVLPLIAIGGIDAALATRARAAGAHGVAVIGSIWRQPDPVLAAKELVDAAR